MKTKHGTYTITDKTIIQDLYMNAIYADKIPTPESIYDNNRVKLAELLPPRANENLLKIEGIRLNFESELGEGSQGLPSSIEVQYTYTSAIPLTFPVARQAEKQWNTARIGSLLEQILDQLRIGNTTSLRTDVLEPITKLAVQGITADAKELQDLSMELASVKSANAIYEVENGRLMATLTEERNAHEAEIRKLKAKARSFREQLGGPELTHSASAVNAYIALEEDDCFLARRILLSAESFFGDVFKRPEGKQDFMLSESDVEAQQPSVQSYIHALCDAMLRSREQQRVTFQMLKNMLNRAVQHNKPEATRILHEYTANGDIPLVDLHNSVYEPLYKELFGLLPKENEVSQ